MMTKKEQKDYLDRWGTHCLLCDREVERKDMHLVESTVQLEIYPDHLVEPMVTKYYMCCDECKKNGELI